MNAVLQIDLIPDQITLDEAFEIFWLAGMKKLNKKKALTIFKKLAKKVPDLKEFALRLYNDIQSRLGKQFGFDAMHPTTYLNGERWEDELPAVNSGPRLTKDISLQDELTDRSWAIGMDT